MEPGAVEQAEADGKLAELEKKKEATSGTI
jgi:hypothetical protein